MHFSREKGHYPFTLLRLYLPSRLHSSSWRGWWMMMMAKAMCIVNDDDCDNGDDGDFSFFLGCKSSLLVLSIRTLSQLPYIIPLIELAAAPTGVPPQPPEWPHLSSLCPHHYTCICSHTYILYTCINSKLGQRISQVLWLEEKEHLASFCF